MPKIFVVFASSSEISLRLRRNSRTITAVGHSSPHWSIRMQCQLAQILPRHTIDQLLLHLFQVRYVDCLFDFVQACLQYHPVSQWKYDRKSIDWDIGEYWTIQCDTMASPLRAIGHNGLSEVSAINYRFCYVENCIIPMFKRMAADWIRILQEYAGYFRQCCLPVSVSSKTSYKCKCLILPSKYTRFLIGIRDAQRHRDTSMDRLRNINNVLEDLTILKTKFNLTLTLNDYMQVSSKHCTILLNCSQPQSKNE